MAHPKCSITSISDLLDKATRNMLNVTTTIASCPDICTLAWGKGNPDLSGIGANISYIIQAVLTVLCGPVLGLIYTLRHRSALARPIGEHLTKTAHSFIDISIAFNIPVSIAAAVRMAQSPPFFEQFFLVMLLGMQISSFMTVAGMTVLLFDNQPRMKSLIRAVYFWVQFLLWIIVSSSHSTDNSRQVLSKELFKGCKSYTSVVDFVIPATQELSELRKNQNEIWLWTTLVVIELSIFALISLWQPMRDHFLQFVYSLDRLFKVFSTIFIILGVVATILSMWSLETMRSKFKAISGADFQDDEWGFGQIIAVCLWIPFCLQVVYYVMCFAWYLSGLNTPGWVEWIQDDINIDTYDTEKINNQHVVENTAV